MNYDEMSLAELKELAKDKNIPTGNVGKEKLIERIREHDEQARTDSMVKTEKKSLLDSISVAVDVGNETDTDHYENVNLSPDEIIRVKSITFGGLTYRSQKTNTVFRWNQIGEVRNMTVDEIIEMNNNKPTFLSAPLVILLDERAISYFRLKDVYEKIAEVGNLKELFAKTIDVIESTIDNALKAGMRDVLISKIKQMIASGMLTDYRIIKSVEKLLKHDLSDAM